ncbi:FecR domain-containing protein [Draconibacterium sp. IB214405]|uniref:FecR family protein n=1 Tax=Draconibacterium sp. IB214405 TaxID=3097352 RepID=UPI002A0FC320|nr:FecR domain-containing protein [Draconibacterium sp. IB214405]MDX8339802.1 FecR domain-containing protein [Draconibacterium sp. IB214405]
MSTDNGNKITHEEFRKMDSEEQILNVAGSFVPPAGRPQQDILNDILNNIEEKEPTRTLPIIRYMKVAAAVALILLSVKVVPGLLSAKQVRTSFAEQQEITLPDGSEVVLNAGSKLKWNKRKFNKQRYLTLTGEAFFDVEKGNEFVISTKNGDVEILGTQLNVFSRNNEFWVSCLEGKVLVRHQNQEQIITPGQMVRLNEEELQKSTSETIENTTSWKEGILHFEETKLSTIFAELERQFDVKVSFDGNDERRATLDFSNKNLQEALDVVCIPMELEYDVNNNKITITEKK